jgi:predicted transglutaminase-like cysteine proteinase
VRIVPVVASLWAAAVAVALPHFATAQDSAQAASATASADAACPALDLPVSRTGPPPSAYQEFCRANPGACRLAGPAVMPWTPSARALVARVNRQVNAEVRSTPDTETTGEEETWRYPTNGRGDCEDIALEKRRRLVAQGLPAAALTMAIVAHRARLFTHAVLLAETGAGTYVLDALSTDPVCWNRSPYNFETREQPDGHWVRYDQRTWTFDRAPAGHINDCVRTQR